MGGKNSGRPSDARDKKLTEGVCVVCGDKFKARSNRIYCSLECNARAYYVRKISKVIHDS